jgi:glycosyltransferase involved in cell wall biosynthesis
LREYERRENRMEIQILVNHYKENEQTVRRFLSSLARQKGVAFEVLLCSDGGGVKLTQEVLSGFPFPITYAYATHSGVCHTRNLMLDQSSAEYVMFCDIDDEFSDPGGLKYILDAARKAQADVAGSPFFVERKTEDGIRCGLMDHDVLRVHGKIFKREYLVKNSIRFPDEMEISGDMMFLWLAFALSSHVEWVNRNFYTWKWNDSSVTRQKPYHHVRTYDRTLRCYTILAEDLKKRNRPDLYNNLIATLFGMVYVDLTHPKWHQAPKEYRENAELSIRQFLSSYLDDYMRIEEEFRRSKYLLMLRFTRGEGISGEFGDMLPWVERFLYCQTREGQAREVLIVGYGTVGQNLERDLMALKPDIYDKYKEIDTRERDARYSVAFICVDTPYSENHPCDASEVRNAIVENAADVYVVKSTVLPGTVDALCAETGKNIIFSPEYYGGTQHCNNYSFDFTILGGDRKSCTQVIQILQRVYDARHQFRVTDAKTAELAKYMENCFLATKVTFCSQFFNLAENIGVNYEELRELFTLDPRVGASHTFVYRDHPYWDSHCLNKDVRALAGTTNAPFLDSVIRFNEEQKARNTVRWE